MITMMQRVFLKLQLKTKTHSILEHELLYNEKFGIDSSENVPVIGKANL